MKKSEKKVQNEEISGAGAQAVDKEQLGADTSVLRDETRVEELTNDLQRTRADFENFRKQVEIQKENERRTVKLAAVSKMLPLLDDLDRAIASYEELKPLEKSLEKTLKELGLAKVSSEVDVEFDPDLHDAVMVEGEGEKEVIAETLRPGYYYESEVLRPAMVKVKKM